MRQSDSKPRGDIVWRVGERFNNLLKSCMSDMGGSGLGIGHRLIVCILFVVFCAVSFSLFPLLGATSFHQLMPVSSDCTFVVSGHAHRGNEQRFAQVEQVFTRQFAEELDIILD